MHLRRTFKRTYQVNRSHQEMATEPIRHGTIISKRAGSSRTSLTLFVSLTMRRFCSPSHTNGHVVVIKVVDTFHAWHTNILIYHRGNLICTKTLNIVLTNTVYCSNTAMQCNGTELLITSVQSLNFTRTRKNLSNDASLLVGVPYEYYSWIHIFIILYCGYGDCCTRF